MDDDQLAAYLAGIGQDAPVHALVPYVPPSWYGAVFAAISGGYHYARTVGPTAGDIAWINNAYTLFHRIGGGTRDAFVAFTRYLTNSGGSSLDYDDYRRSLRMTRSGSILRGGLNPRALREARHGGSGRFSRSFDDWIDDEGERAIHGDDHHVVGHTAKFFESSGTATLNEYPAFTAYTDVRQASAVTRGVAGYQRVGAHILVESLYVKVDVVPTVTTDPFVTVLHPLRPCLVAIDVFVDTQFDSYAGLNLGDVYDDETEIPMSLPRVTESKRFKFLKREVLVVDPFGCDPNDTTIDSRVTVPLAHVHFEWYARLHLPIAFHSNSAAGDDALYMLNLVVSICDWNYADSEMKFGYPLSVRTKTRVRFRDVTGVNETERPVV